MSKNVYTKVYGDDTEVYAVVNKFTRCQQNSRNDLSTFLSISTYLWQTGPNTVFNYCVSSKVIQSKSNVTKDFSATPLMCNAYLT